MPKMTSNPRHKILLVDDDPDLRDIVGFRLKSAGYEVIQAETGKQAMKLAEKKRPDLVILDVVLPDVTGYGVSMYLRENTKTQDIPIIMISGKRKEDQDIRLGQETGVTYYIEKPYDPVHLLKCVREAVRTGRRGRISDRGQA